MDLKTISDLFDIKLNAFGGGILKDEYEKSLYLTDAQNAYYNALLNQFEDNSTIAIKLAKLLEDIEITVVESTSLFGGNILNLGQLTRGILRDSVQITHTSPLLNDQILSVTEDRLAEIRESLQNPFRQPSIHYGAIRVISTQEVFNKIELHLPAGATLKSYRATIAKMANPIILENLPDGLNIYDQSTATTELSFADPEILEIVNLAVNTVLQDMGRFAAQKGSE
jgi:hypothetical protein